jgi:thiol-disulfide isomerase/thioredoxin
MSITATMDDVPQSISFKRSSLNEDFKAYQGLLTAFSSTQKPLQASLAQAKNADDSSVIIKKMQELGKEVVAYRRNYIKAHPGNLLSSIFSAMEIPEIPKELPLLPAGKVDSSFAFTYYKTHYWNGFNFRDDRLIHTPLLQSRLNEYFNKLVYPQEDSAIVAADSILSFMRGSENLFKFTLNWLSANAQTSNIMGMDKVFVHLVENYYMKGDAAWLSNEELTKYIERAQKIAPNVINNPAPELNAFEVDMNPKSLYDFKARYTLLIFYSPDCGHCIKEIPVIDSLYRATLKEQGVRIWAFNVDKEDLKWRTFITKYKLEDWQHIWDPKHTSRYWAKYDVQMTPSIYLLDEQKIIRGKKLDKTTIPKVVDFLERKAGRDKL